MSARSRYKSAVAAAAVLVIVTVATSCTSDRNTPPTKGALDQLPSGAVGAVSVGPEALPVPKSATTTVVVFGADGNELGRVQGPPISSAKLTGWSDGVSMVTGDAVQTLTTAGTHRVKIDENMAEGVAQFKDSQQSLFWFNTAQPNGQRSAYKNNYVMTDGRTSASNEVRSLDGIIVSAAHCGDAAYAVVADAEAIIAGKPSVTNELFRIPKQGPAVKITSWSGPTEFRPLGRTSLCNADGSEIWNVYGMPKDLRDETGTASLTLMGVKTRSGERSEQKIDMKSHPAAAIPGSMSMLGKDLIWSNQKGSVLATTVGSSSPSVTARELWTLPDASTIVRAASTSASLSVIRKGQDYSFSQYAPGDGRLRRSLKLPWLDGLLDDSAGGGVLGVASVG